jgi:hypothetical protein
MPGEVRAYALYFGNEGRIILKKLKSNPLIAQVAVLTRIARRVVVVMVVVGDVPSDVEHRLDIVRRRVGLDARNSGLLLPGHEGTLAASADVLQALLLELAMDHHTDACRCALHDSKQAASRIALFANLLRIRSCSDARRRLP